MSSRIKAMRPPNKPLLPLPLPLFPPLFPFPLFPLPFCPPVGVGVAVAPLRSVGAAVDGVTVSDGAADGTSVGCPPKIVGDGVVVPAGSDGATETSDVGVGDANSTVGVGESGTAVAVGQEPRQFGEGTSSDVGEGLSVGVSVAFTPAVTITVPCMLGLSVS